MSRYTPDVWEVVKVVDTDGSTVYKVLAGWYGGYANGDSWQFSSGIDKYTEDDKWYAFHNHSGSIYKCHKESKRTSGLTMSTYLFYQKELDNIGCSMVILDNLDEISGLRQDTI